MSAKEATARIKIDKLLEAAGWRFFPEGDQPANILLELGVAIQSTDLDALGTDFEKSIEGWFLRPRSRSSSGSRAHEPPFRVPGDAKRIETAIRPAGTTPGGSLAREFIGG